MIIDDKPWREDVLKIPTRPNNPNISLASQERLDQRESWHKLVVKILTWKDQASEGNLVREEYRITAVEWETYSKHMVAMNTSYSREKMSASLKATKEIIEKNGGFAEDVILLT